jgi:hypothetical protein
MTGCNTAATVRVHATYGAVHLRVPVMGAAAAAAQQGMHLQLGKRQLAVLWLLLTPLNCFYLKLHLSVGFTPRPLHAPLCMLCTQRSQCMLCF